MVQTPRRVQSRSLHPTWIQILKLPAGDNPGSVYDANLGANKMSRTKRDRSHRIANRPRVEPIRDIFVV